MSHPSQRSRHEQALPLLERFFEQQSHGRSPATRERYDQVRRRLLRFLAEGDMSRCLDLSENAWLAQVRQRGQGFFDAFGLEEMLVCLVRFVDDDWLPSRAGEARTQVMLVARLVATLQQSAGLDRHLLGCSVYETEAAVRAAKKRLTPDRVPDRVPEQPLDRPSLRLIRGGLADG